ncbi:MAG: tetratricopeptide repeat protein [Planctomycetes bacterium]|nr:tetratricopeptide repeat protein [Planctomycetota bacterium]
MVITSPHITLDELLARNLNRANFDALAQHIYDSYSTVDRTHNRIKQMQADLDEAAGDQKRDLAEKLGVLQFAMGRWRDAIDLLKTVGARKNAAHFLGRAYLELGEEEQALGFLKQGRAGEQDIQSDMLIIEALCRLRQEEEAEKLLAAYHGLEDEPADLHYARGRVAEAWGRYGEAIQHYETALEKDPEHPRSLFRLALNCDLNGEDQKAMILYRQCVNLHPTFVGALINLGILCEDYGQYEEAIDCYKRVLAIEPRHEQAQMYLKDAEASLTMYIDTGKSRRMRKMEEIFKIPVDNFELSARSRDCLERMDIKTVGGLTKISRDDLLNVENFGNTSMSEIESLLARYDLKIGKETEDGTPLDESGAAQAPDRALQIPVQELQLSTRALACMEKLGITTLGELLEHTGKQLIKCPNFGKASLKKLQSRLAELGLSLKDE